MLQRAVHDAHQRHDADVVVEPGVDDQRLQRARPDRPWAAECARTSSSSSSVTFSPVLALTRTASSASMPMISSISLMTFAGSADGRSILLMHRHDFEALLDGRVAVGDALRLDALRRVDHQQRAFAGRQRARDFVGEVHVPRRVDEVQLVALAVARVVAQRHALRLDGDAALALEVHGVEHLRLHLAVLRGRRRSG